MSIFMFRPSVQPQRRQRLLKRSYTGLRLRIVPSVCHEHADLPHPVGLLRPH
jgi:hypothetical protein